MSAGREAALTRRLQLLEMEAQLQRTALAASFHRLEKRGALDLLVDAGGFIGRLLALPELRWLLLSALWRAFSRRRSRD
ncbi:MAG TPA: hypothetical protein VMB48_08050 [Steroidobacteraceae bacterium]|nr:hypothetical protein [Steroidobacteraceae bacterium]